MTFSDLAKRFTNDVGRTGLLPILSSWSRESQSQIAARHFSGYTVMYRRRYMQVKDC